MTPEQAANAILALIGGQAEAHLSPQRIGCDNPFIEATPDSIVLDDTFTPEQLEALLSWMRDPAGVCAALPAGPQPQGRREG